jgi:hypothetical protein
VVPVGEPPIADRERKALPNVASEDVDTQARRALGASRGGHPLYLHIREEM